MPVRTRGSVFVYVMEAEALTTIAAMGHRRHYHMWWAALSELEAAIRHGVHIMQRLSSVLAGILVVALFAGPSARPAQASDFDKLTYVTFSGPVEIPGVVLPAGTYIFKLEGPDTGNMVVQVRSKDGKTVYATFFSTPETRPAPAGEMIVTLYKGGMATGSPEAVKAWFYPGETTGFQFLYPKEQAKKAASAN